MESNTIRAVEIIRPTTRPGVKQIGPEQTTLRMRANPQLLRGLPPAQIQSPTRDIDRTTANFSLRPVVMCSLHISCFRPPAVAIALSRSLESGGTCGDRVPLDWFYAFSVSPGGVSQDASNLLAHAWRSGGRSFSPKYD